MPQTTSYNHITNQPMFFEHTLKGNIAIKNQLTGESISTINSPCTVSDFSGNFDDNYLSKNIFYACNICEGPLAPISTCTLCKRASLRKCTSCGIIRELSQHENCKMLVSLRSAIIKKYRRKKLEEKSFEFFK